MKLSSDVRSDGVVHVVVRGELEVASCACLRNFWELRVAPHDVVDVDLREAETGDGQGVATLASLVEDSLRAGARVTLRHAPQMVAHTLYKTGRLRDGSALELVAPREEEPYGG